MVDARTLWLLVPKPVRRFPADLAAVLVLVALAVATFLVPGLRATPLRVLFGIPFVLFLPGYAITSAMFPERNSSPSDDPDAVGAKTFRSEDGITAVERVLFSVGLSLLVVPVFGYLLTYTPWNIRLVPAVVSIGTFTAVVAVVAAVRRWSLPDDAQFRVRFHGRLAPGRSSLRTDQSSLRTVLSRSAGLANVVLALSLVLGIGGVTYAVTTPSPDPSYTEVYLLTENESGQLVAGGYPTELNASEETSLVVGIANHEGRPTNYSVVVRLQRTRLQNDSVRVVEQRRLERFDAFVEPNATWQREHAVRPTMTGQRLRLQYLFYRGTPPSEPSAANAYRRLELWLNVTAPSESPSLDHPATLASRSPS